MSIREVKNTQIISVVIAALSTVFCLTAFLKPDLLDFPSTAIRVVSSAAIVNSVSGLVIGIMYLVILTRTRSAERSKGIAIAIFLLLCVFSVLVEPFLYNNEARQIAMAVQNTDRGVDELETLLTANLARSAIREVVVLVMFVSKALTFLSLGGFWRNPSLQRGEE